MSIDIATIQDHVTTVVTATGQCARVLAYEPKSDPGGGVTAAHWVANIRRGEWSGLSSGSLAVDLTLRLYRNALDSAETQRAGIDPALGNAMIAIIQGLCADLRFTVGSYDAVYDPSGVDGGGFNARSGYIGIGGAGRNTVLYRIVETGLTFMIDDVFPEAE